MSAELDNKSGMVFVDVAGVEVSIECHPPGIADQLRRYYAAFPGRGQFHLKAVVEVDAAGDFLPNPNPEMTFENNLLQLTSPGFSGWVDTRRKRAQLNLSSAYVREGIDYFLRIIYAVLAFESGGLMFHAAGIVRNGKAHLFFGHSGSGKTTVARLSPNDLVLNDDLLVLMPKEGTWWAYATPFWNPTQVQPTRQCAPLAGLYRLVQSQEVFLESMSPARAVAEMISSVPVIPVNGQASLALLARLRSILSTAPAYRLHFLPNDSFWGVIDSR